MALEEETSMLVEEIEAAEDDEDGMAEPEDEAG